MSRLLRKLLREIHRRSVWQVLAVYVLLAWSAWEAIRRGTVTMGLPDWTPGLAGILLLLGLPMVVGAAIVQRGVPSLRGEYRDEVDPMALEGLTPDEVVRHPPPRPFAGHTIFTWRNAVLGGVCAAALLAGSMSAYLMMWSLGIGPVGSLVAQGAVRPGSLLLLADFEDASAEGLGAAVTEALRQDLLSSRLVEVVERGAVPSAESSSTAAARRAARAEGIPLVLEGAVERMGSGYRVNASLHAVELGRTLATFRVSASHTGGLVDAVDALAEDVREKMGESLRSIRAAPPLPEALTSSARALSLLAQGSRLLAADDPTGAIEPLEQAVALDPGFGHAWSVLSRAHRLTGESPRRAREAALRAREHRGTMLAAPAALAEARYHRLVTWDRAAAVEAYLEALRIRANDRVALAELAEVHTAGGRHVEAAAIRRRLAEEWPVSPEALGDLAESLLASGAPQRAAEVVERWAASFPDDPEILHWRGWTLWASGDEPGAAHTFTRLVDAGVARPGVAATGHGAHGWLAIWQGRLGDARLHFLEAERLAEEVDRSRAWELRVQGARAALFTGQAGWAVSRLSFALQDGTWDVLPRVDRRHAEVALLLALAGDETTARRVLEDHDAGVREDGLVRDPAIRLATEVTRFAAGDTAGVVAALSATSVTEGCGPCWGAPRAWALAQLGDARSAAELHALDLSRGHVPFEMTVALRTLATLRLGGLLDAAGDVQAAVAAHRRLLRQWAQADPSGRAFVERARIRLEALGAVP